MAWWNPFSWGRDEDEENRRAEEQRKANAALIQNTVRPYSSLTEIPVGKSLNDTILAALNTGKGIGFGEGYAERTTNPYIASREARYAEEELPQLSAELSGRGLGRSTIAGESIRKAGAQKERDINELMATAYKENEAQKKLDQSRYENLGLTWTGAEASQRGAYSADDMARAKSLIGINDTYYDTLNNISTQNTQDINQLIGAGLKYVAPAALAPLTGGASLAMYGTSASDIANELTKVNEAKNASGAYTKRKTTWV